MIDVPRPRIGRFRGSPAGWYRLAQNCGEGQSSSETGQEKRKEREEKGRERWGREGSERL